jgi:hypothetical protein
MAANAIQTGFGLMFIAHPRRCLMPQSASDVVNNPDD